MTKATLGRTGIAVNKDGFGALPIQRISAAESTKLLQKAQRGGINFFDTSRVYTDSEEKIGLALSDVRDKIIIATKSMSSTPEGLRKDLETSLRMMKTDYVDILQFHNLPVCPLPGDGSGMYEEMEKLREEGKIRFIGITNHRLEIAKQAVLSGRFDTLQFPFSCLAAEADIELVKLCEEKNVGFIAMKALSGGLLTDLSAARAYLMDYATVVPIWGIQHEWELDELLALQDVGPGISEKDRARIEKDRAELIGNFCRGCGYCLPCPAEIEINIAARIPLFMRRLPDAPYRTEEWQQKMAKIDDCIHCNACSSRCPYGIDTPELLRTSYAEYKEIIANG